jgi:hypothetical protein
VSLDYVTFHLVGDEGAPTKVAFTEEATLEFAKFCASVELSLLYQPHNKGPNYYIPAEKCYESLLTGQTRTIWAIPPVGWKDLEADFDRVPGDVRSKVRKVNNSVAWLS